MIEQVAIQPKIIVKSTFTPLTNGLLQRACACGQHTGNDGECEECKRKRQDTLQRAAVNHSPAREVPPIVHEVLRSPGQPLDAQTRIFMEQRLGHDFSNVRVHTGAKAAESARSVNALAYAVGRDLTFGEGQYAPRSSVGQKLLAHELTHVIQQNHTSRAFQALSISEPTDTSEREADSVADMYSSGELLPLLNHIPLAIHRQPGTSPQQPPIGGTHTITDAKALIREGPSDFKPTNKTLPVGARVDIVDTQSSKAGTFVNVVEHGTGTALGWTSQANLGDVQYVQAGASFVYVANVKPRRGHANTLPVMVYLPPNYQGGKTDIVLYFHGDVADYSAGTADNYRRENPAIGMHLSAAAAGANRIVIAPQISEWRSAAEKGKIEGRTTSPWNTLQAGDYESIVQTVFTNLEGDLKLNAAIERGTFSIAGHSGGGKALGQSVQDLDQTGGGVTDVTLVEAGYGGEEDVTGKPSGSFAPSFQMVRDWLLEGQRGKILRVITKAQTQGTDTRRAIENTEAEEKAKKRIPVLGLAGVINAIKAKGLDGELQADQQEVTTDAIKRTGGLQLIWKIVVSHKSGGKDQGIIYVFLMADPPRAKDVDPHFGVRDATIDDIVTGSGKGDDFAAKP